MTRERQKWLEMEFAKETGELLSESWKIMPSPNEDNWPDLIVTTESGKFGLEVRELYRDEPNEESSAKECEQRQSNKGSSAKRCEQKNLKIIRDLANAYYKVDRPPIKASFLGDISCQDELLNEMISAAQPLSELEQAKIEPYEGCVVYIQRLPDHPKWRGYKRWDYVSDKVGWVRTNDEELIKMIDEAIREKALRLERYRTNISDVRLLLVSNRLFNSGRDRLEDISCEACGFNAIYYLSYPEFAFRFKPLPAGRRIGKC